MTDTNTFSNYQDQPAGAIPVRLVNGAGTGFSNPGAPPTSTPLGYQQITSLTTAQLLTVPPGATYAVIVPDTQAVRYRDDGTPPTASIGMPIPIGTQITYSGNLAAIQFIQQTASAVLNVSYYK